MKNLLRHPKEMFKFPSLLFLVKFQMTVTSVRNIASSWKLWLLDLKVQMEEKFSSVNEMTSWAISPSAADKRDKKSNGNKKFKWAKCLCAPRTKWWEHIARWSSVFRGAHILTGPCPQLSYEQLACQGVLRIGGGQADLMHFRSKYIISQVLNFKKVNSSHGNMMRCTSAHNIKFLKFKKKRLTRRSSSTRREWEFGGLGSRLLWVGRGHPHCLSSPSSLSEGNKSPGPPHHVLRQATSWSGDIAAWPTAESQEHLGRCAQILGNSCFTTRVQNYSMWA